MEEQFVTYEIALKMKELNFNEPCLATLTERKNVTNLFELRVSNNQDKASFIGNGILAPLWQQSIDWLFKNYKITIMYVPQKDILEIDILRAIKSIKK